MKNAFLFLLIVTTSLYSQTNNPKFVGCKEIFKYDNGLIQSRIVTGNENINFGNISNMPVPVNYQNSSINASTIRWSAIVSLSIGDYCQTSKNGLHQVVGWNLNLERISTYGNTNNTPVWEFTTFNSSAYYNWVAASDTGVIACGSFHNVYMFNPSSSSPIFNFSMGTDTAGPTAITSNGKFIVTSNWRQFDTVTIYGFSKDSTNFVWRYKIPQPPAGGSQLGGIKISGNDSLCIINNYSNFYVFRTYTGQLVFQGVNTGTQMVQGISGNGSIIATINYSGQLRTWQWNGSTYNILWTNTEPGGWYTAVDISYDGQYIAAGTLNFPGTGFDGKIKLFRVANGSTPLWTYTGTGDQVTCVSFSKNGNVFAVSTFADVNNTLNDLFVFKTSSNVNVPIFVLNTPGSLFWCSTSADGSTVFASGKAVPARIFGNGGEAYNIFIDTNDAPLGIPVNNPTPLSYNLSQNYPNPFNPSTQITYDIPKEGFVNIIVYDVLGREVSTLVNKVEKAGSYSVTFDAGNINSGVYFYKISADGFTETKKMILIK